MCRGRLFLGTDSKETKGLAILIHLKPGFIITCGGRKSEERPSETLAVSRTAGKGLCLQCPLLHDGPCLLRQPRPLLYVEIGCQPIINDLVVLI